MAGAVLALAGAGAGAGAGVTTPGATSWAAIWGTDAAYDAPVTFTAITGPISITASVSGGGTLQYVLNGVTLNYAGAFTVRAGDTLAWGMVVGHLGKAGTITVTNFTTSTVLQTIAYSVGSSFGFGGYK